MTGIITLSTLKKATESKKIIAKKKKKNRNFRKIDVRPSGISYTFSSQTLQGVIPLKNSP
jgi:hypothetical protein